MLRESGLRVQGLLAMLVSILFLRELVLQPMKNVAAKYLDGWRQSLSIWTKNSMEAVNGRHSHIESEPPQKKAKVIMPTDDVVLRFSKITTDAFTPTRGSKFAAGYDLYSSKDYTVEASGKAMVKTDIQIAVPEGCYGRIAPRSGLAAKNFIDVGAGVIDQDYRGEVKVLLFNFDKEPFNVKKGDRIAQLIMEKICIPVLEECKSLEETERGCGGFGSTGVGKQTPDSELPIH